MKVMLIDDEPIALDVLEVMLSSLEGIQIVGTYTEPAKAIQNMKNLNVDVVFLDMEMGEMNGLQVAEIRDEIINTSFVHICSRYIRSRFFNSKKLY
ncbi:MAG: response regulator transcription factor [Epulopiscium sp.]|nr:response regulator transcription factor [Candidatus Epulonipiscium sp.]